MHLLSLLLATVYVHAHMCAHECKRYAFVFVVGSIQNKEESTQIGWRGLDFWWRDKIQIWKTINLVQCFIFFFKKNDLQKEHSLEGWGEESQSWLRWPRTAELEGLILPGKEEESAGGEGIKSALEVED